MNNTVLTDAKQQKMIENLIARSERDLAQAPDNGRRVRSFPTTGIADLDSRMERYIKEAYARDILMEVRVVAHVTEVLREDDFRVRLLLHAIDKLYQNACQAVLGDADNRYILFSFGYNRRGFYEVHTYTVHADEAHVII